MITGDLAFSIQKVVKFRTFPAFSIHIQKVVEFRIFQANFTLDSTQTPGEFSLSASSLFFWVCQCFLSVLKYVLAAFRISSLLYLSASWPFRRHSLVH